MKQGWERKALGDIAKFYRGLTYSKGDEADTSSKMVLRSNNVDLDTNSLVLEDLKCLREDFVIDDDKKVKPNTILICMSNGSKQHIGKVAYIQDEMNFAFGGFMGLIAPTSNMSGKYVYYTCISSYFKHFLAGIGNGIGITNLRFSDLSSFSVPVPPIAEQEKIVAELDCLSGIIEKKKQQLKELDNLAQSIFYEMFGENAEGRNKWKIAKLGNVCKTTSGGTPSKGHPEYYEGGDIPWLRSGEVNKMNIHETELFITEDGLNNSSAKWFPKGTVVIAMYGATVGQVGILCNPMTTNQAICGIFPNETFTPIYLYHFLLSKKPEYLEIATGGAQANISQNIVRDTVVSCPPLTLQQDFASKIEAIEKQKELIANSIKETETLFNSRMDYYFN